eukprot:3713244-Prymnesium_polylepis.1
MTQVKSRQHVSRARVDQGRGGGYNTAESSTIARLSLSRPAGATPINTKQLWRTRRRRVQLSHDYHTTTTRLSHDDQH